MHACIEFLISAALFTYLYEILSHFSKSHLLQFTVHGSKCVAFFSRIIKSQAIESDRSGSNRVRISCELWKELNLPMTLGIEYVSIFPNDRLER